MRVNKKRTKETERKNEAFEKRKEKKMHLRIILFHKPAREADDLVDRLKKKKKRV